MATRTLDHGAESASRAPSRRLLRRIMLVDVCTVTASSIGVIAGARPLASFMGVPSALPLAITGVVFLPYAYVLYRGAVAEPVDRRVAGAAVVLNLAWVAGSAWVLAAGAPALTSGGRLLVAEVAVLVGVLAAVQGYALRRVR